jgi:hypothetical protein
LDNKKRRGGWFSARTVIASAALLCAWDAFAVDVSGSIVSTTTWFAAQSPYRVVADVTIDGGATLIIEPGVTVYMQPGTNLSVNVGSLRALGTTALPIVITSSAENGGTPAPGNWGALRFRNGTNDAFTVLEHVSVRYGQGVIIESASPTLNFLTLTNNSGPAISIDLNSSPTGVGLQASGNGVNGVVVPPGEVTGSVLWGLQGIPYVVSQGIVSVGRAPTISSVSPNQIAQGQTVMMTVDGTRLLGVESVRFDNSALTAAVIPGGSDTAFTMNVTASAQAATGATGIDVQVAAGKVRLNNAVTVVPPKPPITITNLSPGSLRRGESKSFQATGQNLAGASVATNAAGLTISNISTSSTSVTFTLAASSTAALGDQTLVFTNPAIASGTANAIVTVLDTLPTVVTSPAPVAVPPDNLAHLIKVRLSRVDVVDHSFTATVTNTNVATAAPANFTIAAGQTEASLLITGRVAGQTVLTLVSPTLGTFTSPIFVTTEFSGLNTSFALPLGVVITSPTPTPPPPPPIPLTSSVVGVAFGNYIGDISPKVLTVGTGPVPIVISGAGLGAVTSVGISPSDGLTVGTPTASPDGTSLTVPVTIAANAPTTLRQVIVSAGTSRYLATRADVDRLKIVNPPPVVDSIIPLFATPGTNGVALTVVGSNFQDLQSVSFAPADGITVGSTTVSTDGTQITLSLNIAAGAPLGPRVVIVATLGGVSSTVASPANTFTVVNQIQQSFTPIIAPQVGVVITQPPPPPPPPQTINVGPAVVGVTLGSAITAMSPATGEIGTNVTLSLQGSDLGGVTAVQLNPATGLTVGTPQIAADGKLLTVSVAIATDAPQTIRSVQVLAGSQRIAFASPFAALFRVTPPQPRVDSINPLFLQIGAPLTPLTIGGVNFQNSSQVRVLPPDGMTISTPPTVNADGTIVTVNVAAATGTAPGTRVVTVVTPAGETTSTASVANTLTLTANAGTTFGPFAASLGVVVQQPPPPPPAPTTFGPFASPSLGVVLTPIPQPVSTPQFAASTLVGVALGPYAQSMAPAGALAGQNVTLTISGANLDAVTGVGVVPATGVTLGTLTASADGTQLFVPVTVDAGAPNGGRQLALTSATGPVRFINQAANQFTIVLAIPVISSIDPILGTQGQVVSLLIRATNLQFATGVTITPPDGVTISSTFTVDSTGTQLTILFNIAPDAPIGPRVIQVVTPAGATPPDPTPANTFTIRSP